MLAMVQRVLEVLRDILIFLPLSSKESGDPKNERLKIY
jgi:hypothetical protein